MQICRLIFAPCVLLAAFWPPILYGKERPSPGTAKIAELVREYQADRNSIREAFELPASHEYLDRSGQLAEEWLARLDKIDYDALDCQARVDFHILRSELGRALAETARARKRLAEIAPLVPFRSIVHKLEMARWQAAPLDCQSAATCVAELAEQVKQLREHLAKPKGKPIAPIVALRAADATRALQESLKRWHAFYEGYRPDFAWWLKKPFEDATKQLEDYAKYLREEVAQAKGKDDDPLLGEPIGREALADGIRGEWLPYTADELIAIAERDFAWGETQMKAAARDMKLGDDWKAAQSRVKADYIPPGEQGELIARIAREATEFVIRVPRGETAVAQ